MKSALHSILLLLKRNCKLLKMKVILLAKQTVTFSVLRNRCLFIYWLIDWNELDQPREQVCRWVTRFIPTHLVHGRDVRLDIASKSSSRQTACIIIICWVRARLHTLRAYLCNFECNMHAQFYLVRLGVLQNIYLFLSCAPQLKSGE